MTTKFDNYVKAMNWFDNIFMCAARIVEGDCYDWVRQPDGRHNYEKTYEGRAWFARERDKYPLHPAVVSLMRIYKPDMWQQLLLEWPHKSETDPNRLAYTRDERSGEQNRQVVTTIGKYLRRHFSFAPDDMIRDIVAEHTYAGSIKMADDMAEMVNAVINGPRSCMSKGFNILCDDGEHRHPYAVYDPSLGWGMAVRRDGEAVMGRCLVWRGDYDNDADYKCFVRSYKRERGEHSHSGADEAIESWLKARGYVKLSEWPSGTPLMRYDLRTGGYLMPYIDGSTQSVDEDTFCIDGYGDIQADNTDGRSDSNNCTCDDCGARFNDEEEGGWVGIHEEHHVCQHCLENDYTYAYSRRGNEYYIPNDRVVEVGGSYYDTDYLSDNNIVELADGDYCHEDDAVYVESEDAYYHCDDNDVCFAHDTDRYELKSDCWQCYESNNWYTDETDSVEIDGETYHPDHAPEVEAEDDNTETN